MSVNAPVDGGGMHTLPYHAQTVTLIVHKDDSGYGMKVSGDNPVYVQSVKEGGAAERAGLHSGDKIIKVNGVDVTHSAHPEVVALIKASVQVTLAVQQRPPPGLRPSSAAMPSSTPHHSRPLTHHHSAPSRTTDRITGPRPVDHEQERQVQCQTVYTLQLMLERGQRNVDTLRSELVKSNDAKIQDELIKAERSVQSLQEKLANLTKPADYQGTNPQVSVIHTHHRAKSSPDPLNPPAMSLSEESKRLLASESMSDLSIKRAKGGGGSAWDVDSPRVTPPGTPPPPYGGSNTNCCEGVDNHLHPDEDGHEEYVVDGASPDVSPYRGGSNFIQHPIISMEDDEMSDQEVGQLEDHGPFKSLSRLWEHNAHLAVFLNYVISNSDPSSLLFYLVTDLYKEGNAKEMKKWAYEIHSSFLVPGAPLRLNNVDENVAREIDDVLLKESDKEEILRRIFWKARNKAKEELNEQLADFQQKRTAGLGTIFGPSDAQLDESIHDKNKELKIVETILMPKIEPYLEDIERDHVDIRRFTTAAALGTVMSKVFGLRGPHSNSLLDRCPTFVSKDKSLKAKLIGKSRKVTVRGHHFVAHQYYTVTYCNHCQLIIWGIGPQGYQCSDCSLNIHRHCVRVVEENCPGPLQVKKERGNDKLSKLMDKIRPENTRRKPSSLNLVHMERVKKQSEEDPGVVTDGETGAGDRPGSGGRGGERRPDPVRESEERPTQDNFHNEDYDIHRELGRHEKKPASTTINRSESYKERIHKKKQMRQRRKTSDPNLSKTTNDADCDPQVNSYYNTNSGSSSNSSSTRSLESPSNSVDMVTTGRSQEAVTVTLTANSSWTLPDSDLEAEPDPPDWTREVGEERLRCLDSREKKRQDVINELFHSERSHVRNLKVQYQVFYRPMLETSILPPDQIQLLFPNLEEMLDIHSQFSNSMKTKRRENPVIGDIADLLLTMLDGTSGENFQRAAATFCARQTIALELLKERRRKDSKLHNFLTDAEGNSLCRRLQLKDIIPTGMQRLTKYPLLFENLAKYTSPDNSEEHAFVLRALDRSKEILNHVNQSVREAEDNHRLADIQRRLEKSGFEKMDHPMSGEFKNLDLTKHRLNYEGSLTWRYGKSQKLIDLHVLLLEDVIILLQKQDEKFVLKFMNTASGGERSPSLSPVIKVSTVLVRTNASDPKAIYLVNTSQNAAQIYELVASTCLESKIWFRHITEATEAYKVRDGGKNRRQDAAATKDLNETSSDASKEAGASNEVSKEPGAPSETGKEPGVPSEAGKDLPGDTSSLQGASRGPEGGESSPAPSPSHPPPYEAPSSPADGAESDVKKLGEGSHTPSPGTLQRRTEPLRLTTEESPLIEPTEVVVSQRSVLTAEPVLTRIEQLRRKDETIRQALAEKQRLVADILHVPRDEFETIAELAGEPAMDKDATEVVLAAINQANQLTSLVNDNLKVTEEEAVCATSEVLSASSPRISRRMARLPGVPAYELHRISTTLHSQLTQLLNIIKDRDEEREKLRRELQRSREQLHTMHESQRRSQLNSSPSRPNSYISGSSGQRTDSEDDAGSAHEDEPIDDKTPPLEQQDDSATDVYVDALSGEAEMRLEGAEEAVGAEDATVATPGD